MGDRHGLSENARAFLVEALLQRTEETGQNSRANSGPETESSDKITDGNASFLQHQHVNGTGAFSSYGSHPALEERLQQSPSSGAMSQPTVVGRNFLSPGTSVSARLATGSTKECPGLVNVRRSPPHWSGLGGSPDHLEQRTGSSDVQETDSSPSGSTTHDLRTLSLQERLGVPLPCSSGDRWNANATRTGHNERVPPLHLASDLSNDSAPILQPTSRSGRDSPTPSAGSMRRSLSPARVSEERTWDSGTASGEECCPEEPGDLTLPHDRLGSPELRGCCPGRRGASCAAVAIPDGSSEVTATVTGRMSRLSPEAPSSSPADVMTAGVAKREQLTPPEPTSSTSPAKAPRFPTAMNVEPEEPKDPSLAELGITAELCSRDLWLEFHEHGTEMIITKMGRRMFPTVKVRLHGLRPSDSYIVYMDIVPVDDKRYRYIYHSSEWAVAGPGDSVGGPSRYIHPDSPASGRLWTSQGIVAFDKLKLTNRRVACSPAQISLHSMQKYRPRVHIQWTNDLVTPVEQQIDPRKSLTFSFRETEFITVTAYQNQEITRLKIASNPFAKGFRDVPASKRQRSPSSDSSGSGGGGGGGAGNQRTAKRARQVQVAPPSGGLWNYSYPIPVTHPPLLCVDPFSQITLLQSYGIPLPTYQYEKR